MTDVYENLVEVIYKALDGDVSGSQARDAADAVIRTIVQKYEPVVDYRGVEKGAVPRFVGMRLVSQKLETQVETTMSEGSRSDDARQG